jgi:transcriptional regulator with XRE-family HTH domain
MPAFGDVLRQKRGQMTRAELAEKTGMLVTHIADLENGRYPNPSSETLFKLAAALEIDCRLFAECDFSGEKKPAPGKRGRPKKK